MEQERELRKKEVQIYRDALRAITGGKFTLVGRDEIDAYAPVQKPVIKMAVNDLGDIDHVRNLVKDLLAERAVKPNKIFMVLTCLTEALNNTVKHTSGGHCHVFLNSIGLTAVIFDNGTGINFGSLPKIEQSDHFSSMRFLGSGFTNMLKFFDKLTMSTGDEGTVLILEKGGLF